LRPFDPQRESKTCGARAREVSETQGKNEQLVLATGFACPWKGEPPPLAIRRARMF
jgi:hypothetical protein